MALKQDQTQLQLQDIKNKISCNSDFHCFGTICFVACQFHIFRMRSSHKLTPRMGFTLEISPKK